MQVLRRLGGLSPPQTLLMCALSLVSMLMHAESDFVMTNLSNTLVSKRMHITLIVQTLHHLPPLQSVGNLPQGAVKYTGRKM